MPDQTDAILITYADAIQAENETARDTAEVLKTTCRRCRYSGSYTSVFPYTSDDGFSITDYCKVREELGDWYDIRKYRRITN